MITIERKKVKNIPILQVENKSKANEAQRTVIYYHGFNGEKESSLTIAYKMAEKGIRVILPDAPQHGERAISTEPIEHGANFWDIVLGAVEEVELLKSYIKDELLLENDKIGLGGTSMGGMITYASLRKYEWIQTAAVLMGTPYLFERANNVIGQSGNKVTALLDKVKQIDITENISALKDRPLFIWHGEKDEIVPVADSRKFYERLTNEYTDLTRIQFIEEKERIHNISKLSIKKTAEWFDAQL